MVDILINGIRVANGTGYKASVKSNNDKTDTFDGPVYSHDEFPEISVTIDRISSYNVQYEKILADAIKNNPDGIPITVKDGEIEDKFTGCFIESKDITKDPKKKRTESFSFMAKSME